MTTSEPTTTEPAATPAFGAGLADPAGLGLSGFAATTFFLSAVNAGWIPASAEVVVLGVALFYGGIAQLLAGMWEFAKGNTFGALAFSSYGAFWLSFWYLVSHTDLSKASAHDANHAVGLYLLIWTIITAFLMIAAFKTNTVVLTVFVLLTLTFLALAIGAWTGKAPGVGLARSAATWACSPRSPPGTARSPSSPTSPSRGSCCRWVPALESTRPA